MSNIRKLINLIESVEQPKQALHEGVRFGQKEMKYIEHNAEDFNIGVEYEFHASEALFYSIGDDNGDFDIIDAYERGIIDLTDANEEDVVEAFNSDTPIVRIVGDSVDGIILDTTYIINGEEYSEDDFNLTIFDYEFTGHSYYVEDALEALDRVQKSLSAYLKNKDKAYDEEEDGQLQLDTNVLGEPRLFRVADVLEVFEDNLVKMEEIYIDDVNKFFMGLGDSSMGTVFNDLYDIFVDELGISNAYDTDEIMTTLIDMDDDARHDLLGRLEKVAGAFDEFGSIEIPEFSGKYYGNRGLKYQVGEAFGDENIHTLLDDYGVKYERVVPDSGMIEVITGVMPVNSALANMKRMFELIREHGSTDSSSGMHISVSTNRWDLGDINFEKLMILLNFDHIHTMKFEERSYVDNFNDLVERAIRIRAFPYLKILRTSSSMQEVYDDVSSLIDIHSMAMNKYQSLNAREYHSSNGRIELRYFGGDDYEERFDDIKTELYRALVTLDVSYGDMYEKEFQKAKFVYMDKMCERVFGKSIPAIRKLAVALERYEGAITAEEPLDRVLPKTLLKSLNDSRDHMSDKFGSSLTLEELAGMFLHQ